MSAAKPKTIEHKQLVYDKQNGFSRQSFTPAQLRQLRRTENHLLASQRKQEELKKRRRSEAAKKGAATRALKKKLRAQGVTLEGDQPRSESGS
jgi:hypothetical protein